MSRSAKKSDKLATPSGAGEGEALLESGQENLEQVPDQEGCDSKLSAPEELEEVDQDGLADEQASAISGLSMSARVSAILFVSPRPLSIEALADALRVKPETVSRAMRQVERLYDDQVHGFSLVEVSGGFQLRTAPGAKYAIQKLIPSRARKLTRAAAETLAVVAYKQPVQRAEIEAIRGVDALPTIKTLLDARLIRIVGRETSAGHPALYGTTPTFLEKFGLIDLSQLPSPRELAELADEPGDIEEIDHDGLDEDSFEQSAALEESSSESYVEGQV